MNLNLSGLTDGVALSIDQRDYLIESSVRLGTGNSISANYKLKDGDENLWLCLRNEPNPILIIARPTEDFPSPPYGESLRWQDRDYLRVDGGTIRSIGPSEQGYNRYINLDYWDYCHGSQWLLLLTNKGKISALAGEEISPASLVIYGKPGR